MIKAVLVLLSVAILGINADGSCPWLRFRNPGKMCFTEVDKDEHPMDYLVEKIHQKDEAELNALMCFVEEVNCTTNNKYRSISGYCNNLDKPGDGTPLSLFERLDGNAYQDGTGAPRSESVVAGKLLPNPRRISKEVNVRLRNLMTGQTGIHCQLGPIFGQFLGHDVSYTALIPGIEECAECDNQHEDCMTIPYIRGDNTFNKQHCEGCQEFTRSADGNLAGGNREQFNLVTSFLDLSQVYGSDSKSAMDLRDLTNDNGQLKSQDNGVYMPQDVDGPSCSPKSDEPCFTAGDNRNGENAGLTAMHTLFMAEHNRIAQFFADKTTWSGDDIYQETKRILTAIYQHIVYHEFLPIFLNEEFLKKYNITDEMAGEFFTGYDSSLGVTPFNEFSTAAYRVGHTIVSYRTDYFNETGATKAKQLMMTDNWYNVAKVKEPTMLPMSMISGMIRENAQKRNKHVQIIMHERLLAIRRLLPPFDIISLNIQRGRDHGIPSYNEIRKHYGLPELTSFDDLVTHGVLDNATEFDTLTALKGVYEDVRDIDLFEGITFENVPPSSQKFGYLGEVASNVIGEQFRRFKYSDRYFYSGHKDSNPGAFTEAQLQEIRLMSMASIVCQHTDPSFTFVNAMNTFLKPRGHENTPCENIMTLNLDLFLNPEYIPTLTAIQDNSLINNLDIEQHVIRKVDMRKLRYSDPTFQCDRLCRQNPLCEAWEIRHRNNDCRLLQNIHSNNPETGDSPVDNRHTIGILPTGQAPPTPVLDQPSELVYQTLTFTKKCGLEMVGNDDEGVKFLK